MKIRKVIVYLLGFIVLALPLNNLLSESVIRRFGLSVWILLWKEVLIVFIVILMLVGIATSIRTKIKAGLRLFSILYSLWPILVYLGCVLLATISSVLNHISPRDYVYGFRFELFWVGFFAVSISWILAIRDKLLPGEIAKFVNILKKAIYTGYILVFLITSLSLIIGQEKFLAYLNYADDWGTADSIVLNSPTCHSIDASGNGCRLSGGFNNPNHFASYLLLILPVFIISLSINLKSLKENLVSSKKLLAATSFEIISVLSILGFIFLTYARFALLSLFVSLVFALMLYLKNLFGAKLSSNVVKTILVVSILSPIILLVGFIIAGTNSVNNLSFLPSFISKAASTEGHYNQTSAAIEITARTKNIWLVGYGLGQSGTVAKPQYKDVADTKIVEDNLDIAQKYDIKPYNLPVPENWFLQVILNGGFLYAILYIFLLGYSFGPQLIKMFKDLDTKIDLIASLSIFSFYSIFVGNLFLHIWESQIVTIYFVILWVYFYLLHKDVHTGNNLK